MRRAAPLLLLGFVTGLAAAATAGRCSCSARDFNCSQAGKTSILPEEVCPRARRAILDYNEFVELPNGLQAFEAVTANHNRLTNLPHASLLNPRLKVLQLKFNKIHESSDELRPFSLLEELRLDNNELSSLEFLPQPCHLRILSMLDTKISTLYGPLQSCTNLTHLYITSGRVRVLSNAIFSQMSYLEELWLSGHSISDVPIGAFRNLRKLKILRLSSNENITIYERSFEGLSALETLDLSMCNLTTLPHHLFASVPRLETLELLLNNFHVLPDGLFSGLHWLTEVKLGFNQLTEMPVLRNCCAHLEKFELYENNISVPTEETLRAALQGNTQIDLTRNPIQPHALTWVLEASDITTNVTISCDCGSIQIRQATARFCVASTCGREDTPVDWKAVVRNHLKPGTET